MLYFVSSSHHIVNSKYRMVDLKAYSRFYIKYRINSKNVTYFISLYLATMDTVSTYMFRAWISLACSCHYVTNLALEVSSICSINPWTFVFVYFNIAISAATDRVCMVTTLSPFKKYMKLFKIIIPRSTFVIWHFPEIKTWQGSWRI